jgi:hypothetical protein
MFYLYAVRKIVFIVAIVLFLKPVLPVFEYIVNYEYISKVLCVNKEKPKMQCNGKCHLMKELAKSSENEKPISDKKIITPEFEVLFFQEIRSVQICNFFFTNQEKENDNYSNLYTFLKNSTFFRPPNFIS